MPIIAFTGPAGCGKDTAASFLGNSQSTRLSFADALRQDLIENPPSVQKFWRELHNALTMTGEEAVNDARRGAMMQAERNAVSHANAALHDLRPHVTNPDSLEKQADQRYREGRTQAEREAEALPGSELSAEAERVAQQASNCASKAKDLIQVSRRYLLAGWYDSSHDAVLKARQHVLDSFHAAGCVNGLRLAAHRAKPEYDHTFWERCLPGFTELRQKVQSEIAEHGHPISINETLGKVPASLIHTTDRSVKESLCTECGGLSPRLLMQSYGSFMRNSVNPHYWVNRLTEKVKTAQMANPYQRILITDTRYENEADALRGMGALIVHVERADSSDGAKGAAAKHESEAGVARKPGDVIVHNDQGLKELGAAMKAMVSGGMHPLSERIPPEQASAASRIQVQPQGASQFQNNTHQQTFKPFGPAASSVCRP